MRIKKIIFLLNFIFLQQFAEAQNTITVPTVVIDGDTMPYIILPDFTYKQQLTPAERLEKIRLYHNVMTVLPYAKMAAFRLQMMEQNLHQITGKRARKKYVKETEKQLKKEFTDRLKDLTINQGKILVKLIHRETGTTVYDLLENYSGSVETFFWNNFAKFWSSDISATYDPVEDYRIEQIIKQLGVE